MTEAMSQNEPGLELHEWETRWSELDELFAEDPAGALPEACDFVEHVLRESRVSTDGDAGEDELMAAYRAARDTADRIERGDRVDPGDVAAAVENLRALYDTGRVTRER